MLFSLFYFCQTWVVLWRPRGPKLYLRARALSSTLRGYTASPGRRSPGSETDVRFPPAAACESAVHLGSVCFGVRACDWCVFSGLCVSTCAHIRAVLRTTSPWSRISFTLQNSEKFNTARRFSPIPPTPPHTATPKLSGSSWWTNFGAGLCVDHWITSQW